MSIYAHGYVQTARGMCSDEVPYWVLDQQLAEAVERVKDIEEERDALRERAPDALPSVAVTLVGTAEVVELLGVPRSTISRWRRTGKMPEPLAVLAATPVWDRAAIEALRS